MLVRTHAASICKKYTQYKIVYEEKQRGEFRRNQDSILEAEEARVLKGTQQILARHQL